MPLDRVYCSKKVWFLGRSRWMRNNEEGGGHNDAPRTIIRCTLPAADLLHSLLGVARHSAVLAVPAFTLRPRSCAPWLQALQLPRLSFAAKNLVWAYTASSHFSSDSALACRVPWRLAALPNPFSPTYGRPRFLYRSTPLAYFKVVDSAV